MRPWLILEEFSPWSHHVAAPHKCHSAPYSFLFGYYVLPQILCGVYWWLELRSTLLLSNGCRAWRWIPEASGWTHQCRAGSVPPYWVEYEGEGGQPAVRVSSLWCPLFSPLDPSHHTVRFCLAGSPTSWLLADLFASSDESTATVCLVHNLRTHSKHFQQVQVVSLCVIGPAGANTAFHGRIQLMAAGAII